MNAPLIGRARVVDTPLMHAAVMWTETGLDGLPHAQEARPTVRRAVEARGLETEGRTLTVWRLITPERVRIAPGVLVTAPFRTRDALDYVELPAGPAAHLRLEGTFEALGQAMESLFMACHRNGWRPSGLNWEIYQDDDVTGGTPIADLYAQLG